MSKKDSEAFVLCGSHRVGMGRLLSSKVDVGKSFKMGKKEVVMQLRQPILTRSSIIEFLIFDF